MLFHLYKRLEPRKGRDTYSGERVLPVHSIVSRPLPKLPRFLTVHFGFVAPQRSIPVRWLDGWKTSVPTHLAN